MKGCSKHWKGAGKLWRKRREGRQNNWKMLADATVMVDGRMQQWSAEQLGIGDSFNSQVADAVCGVECWEARGARWGVRGGPGRRKLRHVWVI